jgi:hypothetical protein
MELCLQWFDHAGATPFGGIVEEIFGVRSIATVHDETSKMKDAINPVWRGVPSAVPLRY